MTRERTKPRVRINKEGKTLCHEHYNKTLMKEFKEER
jgi:hypothetical protein